MTVSAAIQHAASVLQISLKRNLSADDNQRLQKYLNVHYGSAETLLLHGVREISGTIPGINMECDNWAKTFQEALPATRTFIPLFIYINPPVGIDPILFDSKREEIGVDTHFATMIKFMAVGWYVFDNLNTRGIPLVNFIPEINFEITDENVAGKDVRIAIKDAASLRNGGNPRSAVIPGKTVVLTLATLVAFAAGLDA